MTALAGGFLGYGLTWDEGYLPPVPALQSYWIKIHVPLVVTAYAAFLVAAVTSAVYLVKYYFCEMVERGAPVGALSAAGAGGGSLDLGAQMRAFDVAEPAVGARRESPAVTAAARRGDVLAQWLATLPSLARLDMVTYRVVALGTLLLGIGIVTGAMWAREAWGAYWQWDPKETAALFSWIVYLGYLHLHTRRAWQGLRCSWVSRLRLRDDPVLLSRREHLDQRLALVQDVSDPATTGVANARPLDGIRFADGYAALGEQFIERRRPTPIHAPYLVAFNPDVAALLEPNGGLRPDAAVLDVMAGNAVPAGADPWAAVYAGHQFGVFVRQLGDGRAITLGEVDDGAGGRWEWQLKGAGTTAFSRFGDGRAVLRSTIREYLCSEAMHHLGIPTTRALGIAGSDDPVYREVPETAAVLSRIAPSHVRFGTFEYFHYRGADDDVRILADATIARFFGEIDATAETKYADFLRAVAVRTARLVAKWQAVGFEHGVMNTDNMSILGLTLDYGPFGFMERYDPGWICNHSDEAGRYAFDRQPGVALWNCHALAAALAALVPREEAEAALGAFEPAYRAAYLGAMHAKLGLSEERPDDVDLILTLLDALARDGADYTTFFRRLSDDPPAGDALGPWLARYRERVAAEGIPAPERRAGMLRSNPAYVLRNHLAQAAIERAQAGDFGEVARLADALRAPYDERPEYERYAEQAPVGTPTVEVSCSS